MRWANRMAVGAMPSNQATERSPCASRRTVRPSALVPLVASVAGALKAPAAERSAAMTEYVAPSSSAHATSAEPSGAAERATEVALCPAVERTEYEAPVEGPG